MTKKQYETMKKRVAELYIKHINHNLKGDEVDEYFHKDQLVARLARAFNG